ncbi:MAG TPA: c-type cytochrome, partial [Polyangiaceae bacterium]|nr:c-type cytochrome [Polyangiaceae bacterium]
ALTYAWSAPAGSFADATADQTTYTCTESGEQTLSVSVRDVKGCETSKDVVVTCTSDEPPADQPPADQPPADQPPADQPPADQPPADQPPAEGSELPCDVQAILASRCLSCHGEPLANGAPMPLVTLADVKAEEPDEPGTYMYQNVEKRIQSTTSPMPPKGLPALTDDERATLVAWIDQGAPGSDAMCEPAAN